MFDMLYMYYLCVTECCCVFMKIIMLCMGPLYQCCCFVIEPHLEEICLWDLQSDQTYTVTEEDQKLDINFLINEEEK